MIGNHTRPCLNINHNPDSQMYKLQTEILTLFVFINTLRNEICVRGDKITHKNSCIVNKKLSQHLAYDKLRKLN